MDKSSVSVIVPALNEERTISATVAACRGARSVLEVIVVDDKSSDKTASLARSAGAEVLTSAVRGKGKSMEDGLAAAHGAIIVFVDADIKNFSSSMVDVITSPIIKGECDFVKSTYGRKSGRVTELVARPLLSILFPSLLGFRQPLSGIIAGRARFFRNVRFENDYGVDVGILIDMVNLGARVMEVDIGYIRHKMKPWHKLAGMSEEVARSILKRARMTNKTFQDGLIAEASLLGGMLAKGAEVAFPIGSVAFLDIDGTVLIDRFIFSFSKKKGFVGKVRAVSGSAIESYGKTSAIASRMAGMTKDEIVSFARSMKLTPGVAGLVERLKKKGFFIVLISDGYECVAREIARRTGADHVIANRLVFEGGVCSGAVEINPLFLPMGPSCGSHAVCKLTAAMRFCLVHDVPFEKTFAIGNSPNDICLLRFANLSYAFKPDDESVAHAAKKVVHDMARVRGF